MRLARPTGVGNVGERKFPSFEREKTNPKRSNVKTSNNTRIRTRFRIFCSNFFVKNSVRTPGTFRDVFSYNCLERRDVCLERRGEEGQESCREIGRIREQ